MSGKLRPIADKEDAQNIFDIFVKDALKLFNDIKEKSEHVKDESQFNSVFKSLQKDMKMLNEYLGDLQDLNNRFQVSRIVKQNLKEIFK